MTLAVTNEATDGRVYLVKNVCLAELNNHFGHVKKAKIELIRQKIYPLRKNSVMLDFDLAELYGVDTKVLNQAVKRNADRFPPDFMFDLSKKEFEDLRSQFVTAKSLAKRRTMPKAFTEHGILMLSSVLNSKEAVQVNIQIMRVFTKMRQLLSSQIELSKKLDRLERQGTKNSKEIQEIWTAIKELYGLKEASGSKKIGFDQE